MEFVIDWRSIGAPVPKGKVTKRSPFFSLFTELFCLLSFSFFVTEFLFGAVTERSPCRDWMLSGSNRFTGGSRLISLLQPQKFLIFLWYAEFEFPGSFKKKKIMLSFFFSLPK